MKNINSFRSLFWIAFLCWGCSDLEREYCFPDVSPPFQNEDRLSFFFLDVDSLSCIYCKGPLNNQTEITDKNCKLDREET